MDIPENALPPPETGVRETAFRRLAEFPPSERLTRRLTLKGDGGAAAPRFFTVSAGNGDILLNAEIVATGDALVAAQRIGGAWSGRVEQPLATREAAIVVTIGGEDVTLDLAGGARVSWPTPGAAARARTIDAQGDWSLASAALLDGERDVRDLVALDAPPRGLAQTAQPDLVFDIGANNGDDTAFYLAKGFRVVALDADPALCARLAERFAAAVADGRLTLLNLGLAPTRGRMTFYVNAVHDEWSSFDREIASRGHPVSEVMVPTLTTLDLFDAFGVPWFLKIDIEGYDDVPVRAVAAHSVKPRHLSFENGAPALFEALAAAGYLRFQLVNQARVPEAACPVPAREGLTVPHRFAHGSSGPFGRDLPEADWRTAEAMRETLRAHHARIAQAPDSATGEWFDLHATMDGDPA